MVVELEVPVPLVDVPSEPDVVDEPLLFVDERVDPYPDDPEDPEDPEVPDEPVPPVFDP